jgi:hypothetical protein
MPPTLRGGYDIFGAARRPPAQKVLEYICKEANIKAEDSGLMKDLVPHAVPKVFTKPGSSPIFHG